MFFNILIGLDVLILLILFYKPSFPNIVITISVNAIYLTMGLSITTTQDEIVQKYYYNPTKYGNVVIVESEQLKDVFCFKPDKIIYQQTDLKSADIILVHRKDVYGFEKVDDKILIKKREKKPEEEKKE